MDKGKEKNKSSKWSIQEIAELGVMIAALEAGKMLLNAIPNVEIVTFLIVLFTLHFGKKTLVAVYAFLAVECFLFPMHLWIIMYAYIWPLLVLIVLLLKKWGSHLLWCIVAALYGLLFGGLCSIVYIFTSGIETAFLWWIAGIPFDVVHGVANFAIMFLLFPPLNRVFAKYCGRKLYQ